MKRHGRPNKTIAQMARPMTAVLIAAVGAADAFQPIRP